MKEQYTIKLHIDPFHRLDQDGVGVRASCRISPQKKIVTNWGFVSEGIPGGVAELARDAVSAILKGIDEADTLVTEGEQ